LPYFSDTSYRDILPTWPLEKQKQYTVFKDLDPILHSQLRLAVMSLLISVKEAEFTFLKDKTNATAGNLSVQIQKLRDAGYIDVVKQFKDNYPQTICKVTSKGITAFEKYVENLKTYLGN
ncbi:MAG TPA: transcriptional regulator, partial [Flavisolibacter sp.]|nr:transcriptional regulator [Flavisolibacter sp.]